MNNDDLSGKSILVTGATSGIGLAAVKKFVSAGAFVIGVGRSEVRCQNAHVQVMAGNPQGKAVYFLADLSDPAQIRAVSQDITQVLKENQFSQLDVLVNNAGVYLERKELTQEGIEKTFAVNHLAPFLLTHEMLGLLVQADPGRVLTVSSYSHRTTPLSLKRIANPSPYIGLLAYKRSKLCNVLFTRSLNQRFDRLQAFAVDPGLVNTAIASKGVQGISHWVWRSRRKKGTDPEVPVKTLLYLAATDQIDLSQGIYIKNSQPKNASRKSHREDLAEALWALSCELTGLSW